MSSNTFRRVQARSVLDSRGCPTVEVEIHCEGGAWGRAIVPSGASTGRHEAKELRDGDPGHYEGKGVLSAIATVHEQIAPCLVGRRVTEQVELDRLLCELDGTPDKSRLGANAILGVSLAWAHAAAAVRALPLWRSLEAVKPPCLPLPMVNLISGGLHAGGNLDVQDFLLIPIGASSYSEALHMAGRVYRALGRLLGRHGYEGVLVGDEGGFGPRLKSNEEALDLIVQSFLDAGYEPGRQAAIAIDAASTHFYIGGTYRLRAGGEQTLSSADMIELLNRWVDAYPVVSIEDGLAEDDWAGWQQLTHSLGRRVQLIGDDLFVTSSERLKRGISQGVANSLLVKLNQVGTLSETMEVMRLACAANYRTVISARSGETEDTTIADLAVASGAGQIKIGSVARSERLAKYNQLLRIEEQIGTDAQFARWKV